MWIALLFCVATVAGLVWVLRGLDDLDFADAVAAAAERNREHGTFLDRRAERRSAARNAGRRAEATRIEGKYR